MDIGAHALEQTSLLLDRMAFRANRVAKSPSEDAIHDLRVAIRRFAQSLRVFGQFLPASRSKKVRRQLQWILDLSSEIRDRDITVKLCLEAGLASDANLLAPLREERKRLERELAAQLVRLGERNFSRKWRKRLGL